MGKCTVTSSPFLHARSIVAKVPGSGAGWRLPFTRTIGFAHHAGIRKRNGNFTSTAVVRRMNRTVSPNG